ncbi:MAG TPA: hypothetical protein VGJ28_14475 [Micromonosporaceae bacterium]|jgi:hypothetical protein
MAWNNTKWKAVLLDFLERAGWSAGQVFLATLLAGGSSIAGLPWKYASILAAGAAVSSIVLTAVQYLGHFTNLPFWPDLLVRLAKTFLGSLAASFSASKVFDVTAFHWSAALNVAALATLSALGKGLLARGAAVVPGLATLAAATSAGSNPSTLPPTTYLHAIGRAKVATPEPATQPAAPTQAAQPAAPAVPAPRDAAADEPPAAAPAAPPTMPPPSAQDGTSGS